VKALAPSCEAAESTEQTEDIVDDTVEPTRVEKHACYTFDDPTGTLPEDVLIQISPKGTSLLLVFLSFSHLEPECVQS
jgi:hypothetical protein